MKKIDLQCLLADFLREGLSDPEPLKYVLCQINANCRNVHLGRSSRAVGYRYCLFGTFMPFQGGATIPLLIPLSYFTKPLLLMEKAYYWINGPASPNAWRHSLLGVLPKSKRRLSHLQSNADLFSASQVSGANFCSVWEHLLCNQQCHLTKRPNCW